VESGALTRVPLCPTWIQLDALCATRERVSRSSFIAERERTDAVGILQGGVPVLLSGVGGGAVRVEDVVVWIEGDGFGEEVERAAVISGGKGFVACVFERACLLCQ
jgi:hypothetical protein